MTDYVDILKKQVEEERRSGLSSSHGTQNMRQSIQKKKLIPLENPENIENPDNMNSNSAQQLNVESEKENKNLKKPVYKEVSTEPNENEINGNNRPNLSTISTDPINTDDVGNNVSDDRKSATGGALWDAPKEFQDIRSSMKNLPQKQQPQPEQKPCLFDLVMQPPKKELKPTLFTYFDKLMQMGEV